MKKFTQLFVLVSISVLSASAQDEGAVVKRERIERDKNIFIGGGISIPGGANFGDYAAGINFEGGFMKRLNRVVSVGGSVSYMSFKYNAPAGQTNIDNIPDGQFPANFYYIPSVGAGVLTNFGGADVSFISLNANFKFNFVPVKDNSVISIYAFAKPFISQSKHKDLSGDTFDYIQNPSNNNMWEFDPGSNSNEKFESEAKITGGIFLGPGLEINPTKAISIFIQASFGYTFPTNVISTKTYPRNFETYTVTQLEEFPFITDGFTSINFSGGISFNID